LEQYVHRLYATFIVLTTTQGAAEAGLDLPNVNNAPRTVEKRLDHVVSGLDAAQKNGIPIIEVPTPISNAQGGGLDVGGLLGGISEGQGSSKGAAEKADAGNIANQIAGEGLPGLDAIIGGLDKQNQNGAKNRNSTQEQGQAKEKGETKGQDQTNAQNGGEAGLAIQIGKTTIQEANGQQIKTEVVKEVGTQSAAVAPAEGRQTPPPASPAADLKATVRTTSISV
jgi:hypothetical protein